MREGLRSSSSRKIPDLNVRDESDLGLSEEGGDSCCEVSKTEGKPNVSLCEREGVGEDEFTGVETVPRSVQCRVEVEGGLEGRIGNVGRSLQACSMTTTDGDDEIDGHCRVLGCDADVATEVKESGLEVMSCGVDAGKEGDEQKMVEGGKEEEVKEKEMEGNSPGCNVVDSDRKTENMEDVMNCDPDFVQPEPGVLIKSHGRSVSLEDSQCKFDASDQRKDLKTDALQGGFEVGVRVLRSRVVPANGRVEDSGSVRKRKRGSVGREEDVTLKCENEQSDVNSGSLYKQGSLKRSIKNSEETIVQMKAVQVVSEAEDENASKKSVGSSANKGKRGRPRKYVDCSEEKVVQTCKVEVLSEVEDADSDRKSARTSENKRKRGRPKKCIDHTEADGIQTSNVQMLSKSEYDCRNNKSARSSKKKGKCGRPKKLFSPPKKEVEDEAGDISNKSVERKRGRPKKSADLSEEERVETKKVPFCEDEDDDDVEDGGGDVSSESAEKPKKKLKCGRPKKKEGGSAQKMILRDKGQVADDRKMKVSLVTAPVRRTRLDACPNETPKFPRCGVPSNKGNLSDQKIRSCEPETNTARISSKGKGTPLPEKSSVKRKKSEKSGSIAAEKNSIRQQIVDMLLGAGWTIEYRPRQGRAYTDAVYVNSEGKTHWSVTKAYSTLKQEVEVGKVGCGTGNANFCFTPVPEEVLSKLFRVVSKTRSDKNVKKKDKKGIAYSSDEEFTKERGKGGAKHRKSAAKRKASVRDSTHSKRRCALLVRGSGQGSKTEGDGIIAHKGMHSILAWMIDSGTVPIDVKVHYMNRRRTKSLLEGSITRDGIRCSCCQEVISVVDFESHAGSKLCEPYQNVYVEGGNSLLQCQIDSWNKQEEAGRTGFHTVPTDGDDPNDDTCGICGDGGDLVCCDGCPSTFHHDCLNIEEVPSGEWHCVYCTCKLCGDAHEAATQTDDDCDTTSSSLVTCCLCDAKYHQSCFDELDAVHTKSRLPTFCGRSCEQIFEQLQSLVGIKRDLGDGFSWTLLQRSDVKAHAITLQPQEILRNSKLAVALSVMDECFLPIIDPRSGINLIRHVVYNCGSNFNRLNFSNFFTFILERGDEVIATASVRIRGKELAEMPFIGTRNIYRRQGMCRRLLSAIELALSSLGVEKMVIPAIPELLDTWTSVFGFMTLDESVKDIMSSMSMLVFPHTGMLQKPLSNQQSLEKTPAVAEENVKCESGIEHLDGGADKSDEIDHSCLNGRFDLNTAASDLPESSPEERLPFCTAENCEDKPKEDGQSGQKENAEEMVLQPDLNVIDENACCNGEHADLNTAASDLPESSPVERHPFCTAENCEDEPKEDGQSAQKENAEERVLQPDLNVIDENACCNGEHVDFPEDTKGQLHHNSGILNCDEVVTSTKESSGQTNNECSIVENAFGEEKADHETQRADNGARDVGTFASGVNSENERILEPDLNMMDENECCNGELPDSPEHKKGEVHKSVFLNCNEVVTRTKESSDPTINEGRCNVENALGEERADQIADNGLSELGSHDLVVSSEDESNKEKCVSECKVDEKEEELAPVETVTEC